MRAEIRDEDLPHATFHVLEIRWLVLGKGYPPTTSSTWPFRLGLGISGARARRRPAEMRAPSHAGVSCRIPPAPRSKTHLALDILTNADVVADLAMRNSVEYRHDTPFGFPLGRVGRVVVLWWLLAQKNDMLLYRYVVKKKACAAATNSILGQVGQTIGPDHSHVWNAGPCEHRRLVLHISRNNIYVVQQP